MRFRSFALGLLLVLALSAGSIHCDCTDTDEDELRGYEQAHDDDLFGDTTSQECEAAVTYLYEDCFMEWDNGFAAQKGRCILSGYEVWRSCIIKSVEDSTTCEDAVLRAEQCDQYA